jgi:hypothetical protein
MMFVAFTPNVQLRWHHLAASTERANTNHVPQKLYQTTLVLLLKGAVVIQTIGETVQRPRHQANFSQCVCVRNVTRDY